MARMLFQNCRNFLSLILQLNLLLFVSIHRLFVSSIFNNYYNIDFFWVNWDNCFSFSFFNLIFYAFCIVKCVFPKIFKIIYPFLLTLNHFVFLIFFRILIFWSALDFNCWKKNCPRRICICYILRTYPIYKIFH
jgi:hypothetical protein